MPEFTPSLRVEKIKSVLPDFHENCGPSETVTLGLNLNGHTFIGLGKYYIGPHMVNEHADIMAMMEKFADECVALFATRISATGTPSPKTAMSAAYAFVDSMTDRADDNIGNSPLWHGWALRDAFVAGAKYQSGQIDATQPVSADEA